MASGPSFILPVLRYAFRLKQLGSYLSVAAGAALERLYDDLVAELALINPFDVSAQAQKEALIAEFTNKATATIAVAVRNIRNQQKKVLHEMAVQNARILTTELRLHVTSQGIAGDRIVWQGLSQRKFNAAMGRSFNGLTYNQWIRGVELDIAQDVQRVVQQVAADGGSLDDAVALIRGERRGDSFVGGAQKRAKTAFRTLARTALNHVSNEAFLDVYLQNSDVVPEVQFVATLDARTTIICARLDGERWPVDSPEIMKPPRHYNCRSTLAPVVDWEGLGVEVPEGKRASKDGPVPASLNYDAWLKKQPRSVQVEVLGEYRTRLFRKGRSLRRLLHEDRRVLTVAELKRLGV